MYTQVQTKNWFISIFFPLLLIASLVFTGILVGSHPVSAANGTWTGNGTASSTYLISDVADLAKLATDVNGGRVYINTYFRLTTDIDLAGVGGSSGWIPIGNNTNSFSGIFDGDGHIIKNININRPSMDYVGLFGCIDYGTVKNLGIASGIIRSNNSVGSVVGFSFVGAVENCYNNSTINGVNLVGGVVGYSYYGTVENCYNTGTINGDNNGTGGVVGLNGFGTVKNCYNTGTISGKYIYAGGIAGMSIGTVENCYNTGTIKGISEVGGIVGYSTYYFEGIAIDDDYYSIITNCYNTGVVNGTEYVGGIVGTSLATIEYCYNSGAVSGDEAVGGVAGFNYDAIESCYNTGAVNGTEGVGGVVGYNYLYSSIANCYNTNTISGTSDIGGVVGYNLLGSVTNCYYNSDNHTGTGIGTNFLSSATAEGRTTANMTYDRFATTIGSAFEKRTTDDDYCYYPELKVFKTDGNTTAQAASKANAAVARRTPTLTSTPSATAIIYGQSLNSSALSGGSAVDPITGDSVTGIFRLANESTTYPSVSDSNSTDYTCTFTATMYPDLYKTASGTTKVTVNKAVITVTADDKSKIYNEDNSALTFQYSGFLNGENENVLTTKPSIATEAAKSSNAGTYPIIVSGGSADNYTFNYVPGTLTVNKATVVIVAEDKSKTVNKDFPEFTIKYSGFLNGDDESVLTAKHAVSTEATKDSPVGTYPIIVSGGSADNYTFNYVPGTLTVNEAFPMLWLILGIAAVVIVIGIVAFILMKRRKPTMS